MGQGFSHHPKSLGHYNYCRIGIYRATKISRKAVFLRVLYFASERVLQRHLLNQTVIKKCKDLVAISRP